MMRYWMSAFALPIALVSCHKLANKNEGKCFEPPTEMFRAELAMCRQAPGPNANVSASCCAYPFLLPSMQLCYHVACSEDSCHDPFEYQNTICVPMPESGALSPKPGKDVQFRLPPKG